MSLNRAVLGMVSMFLHYLLELWFKHLGAVSGGVSKYVALAQVEIPASPLWAQALEEPPGVWPAALPLLLWTSLSSLPGDTHVPWGGHSLVEVEKQN